MNYTKHFECGCKVVVIGELNNALIEYCPIHKAAPDMVEELKYLPEPKSILADAAYTGGDVPKKWINDRGFFNDGYNQALKDIKEHRKQALDKEAGK